MLLQSRGRLTAQQLSEELEVSVRTIYRDMEALSMAGVPVYAERGPGGGCALLHSYRTTLTGLTQDEVRALFMLSIPASLAELGVDHELRVALRKLSAALPAAARSDEERARQRIHLDPTGWSEARKPIPHLPTIHQAVWDDCRLHLTYRLPWAARADWLVEPYGLVAKTDTWYLVCARRGHFRVYAVSRVLDARLSGETFERDEGFDLVTFWRTWCAEAEKNRPSCPVVARVAPEFVPFLPSYFGESIREAIARAGPPDGEGWISVTLPFESVEDARDRILGFGRAVEVLGPVAVRNSVSDYAEQIYELYRRQRPGHGPPREKTR
jgi:predicted DNA-binding transcriptional regulator YafY